MNFRTRWIGELVDQTDLTPGDVCFANAGAWIILVIPGGEAVLLSSVGKVNANGHLASVTSPIAAFQRGPLRRLTGEVIVEPLYDEGRCMFDPDHSGSAKIGHIFPGKSGPALRIPVGHYYKNISLSDGSDVALDDREYSFPSWRMLWREDGKEREFLRFAPQFGK